MKGGKENKSYFSRTKNNDKKTAVVYGGFYKESQDLDRFVECTADYVRLLFRCEFDEVYCVTGNTDRKLGIIFGMFLSI